MSHQCDPPFPQRHLRLWQRRIPLRGPVSFVAKWYFWKFSLETNTIPSGGVFSNVDEHLYKNCPGTWQCRDDGGKLATLLLWCQHHLHLFWTGRCLCTPGLAREHEKGTKGMVQRWGQIALKPLMNHDLPRSTGKSQLSPWLMGGFLGSKTFFGCSGTRPPKRLQSVNKVSPKHKGWQKHDCRCAVLAHIEWTWRL